MILPFRPLGNPAGKDLDFRGLELSVVFGRRHFFVRVRGGDSPDQLALAGLAGRDNLAAVAVLENAPIGDVEPQVGFACLGVGSVAVEASVRENRPDLSLEIDGRWGNIGGSRRSASAPR